MKNKFSKKTTIQEISADSVDEKSTVVKVKEIKAISEEEHDSESEIKMENSFQVTSGMSADSEDDKLTVRQEINVISEQEHNSEIKLEKTFQVTWGYL